MIFSYDLKLLHILFLQGKLQSSGSTAFSVYCLQSTEVWTQWFTWKKVVTVFIAHNHIMYSVYYFL